MSFSESCPECGRANANFFAEDGSGPYCSECRRRRNWEANHPGEDHGEMRRRAQSEFKLPELRVFAFARLSKFRRRLRRST